MECARKRCRANAADPNQEPCRSFRLSRGALKFRHPGRPVPSADPKRMLDISVTWDSPESGFLQAGWKRNRACEMPKASRAQLARIQLSFHARFRIGCREGSSSATVPCAEEDPFRRYSNPAKGCRFRSRDARTIHEGCCARRLARHRDRSMARLELAQRIGSARFLAALIWPLLPWTQSWQRPRRSSGLDARRQSARLNALDLRNF